MESYSNDAIDIYFSLYQNAKTKKVRAPSKIYKSGRRDYPTKTKGIYFLYIGSVVVYVGKSASSIEARIYHHTYCKTFDYVKVIEMADYKNTINSMELFFINLFSPTYNIQDKEYAFDYLLKEDYKKDRDEAEKYIYSIDTDFKETIDEKNKEK